MTEENKKGSNYWKYTLVGCAILIALLVYLDRKRENNRTISIMENIASNIGSKRGVDGIESAKLHEMLKDAADMGYVHGLAQGRDNGLSEGEKEVQQRIAIKALVEGILCEVVSKITSLDSAVVKDLDRTYISKSFKPFIRNKNNPNKSAVIPEQDKEGDTSIGSNDNATANEPIPVDESQATEIEQREEEEEE